MQQACALLMHNLLERMSLNKTLFTALAARTEGFLVRLDTVARGSGVLIALPCTSDGHGQGALRCALHIVTYWVRNHMRSSFACIHGLVTAASVIPAAGLLSCQSCKSMQRDGNPSETFPILQYPAVRLRLSAFSFGS